ncbi:3-isopropylmalate dehydratase [candidate division KSB1 bacterium]|nr:3-isopropylmalate dehydratase [candidate division KSB1 bacterium]
MTQKNKVWHYGDDINTDMLFPGKYTYTCSTAEEIKPHLLEDLDPNFAKNVKAGDLIFAGKNFGCGSSREQPALGLKAVGIQAVVAKSYARIFYRAAINQGLLLIECPEAIDAYEAGKQVDLNLEKGKINVGVDSYSFPTLPPEILAIRDAGGLLEYTRQKLSKQSLASDL